MKTLLIVALFVATSAYASFLPKGTVLMEEQNLGEPQITEEIFKARVAELQTTYAPVMKQFGGNLSIKGDWKNKQVNAYATQMLMFWKIIVTGSLARRPELSPDGLTLIVCHEIGHHLGGFPFSEGTPLGGRWASVEGQSDYFSTFVCAKKMWKDKLEENAKFRNLVAAIPRLQCDTSYDSDADRDLCYRTSVASESVIATMAALMKKPMPQYDTPDTTIATATSEAHPKVQCRFDTLYQGAICPVKTNESMIPGKKVKGGRRSSEAEKEAAMLSCTAMNGFTVGLRPACWFKATM